MKSLQGKVAIVTGGARGIGAAIAEELAKRGVAKIAITYLSNTSAAEGVVSKLQALGATAIAIKADVGDLASAPTVIENALDALGTKELDILVNNAASTLLRPLDDIKIDDFHAVFNTNIGGPLFLIQAALPRIRRGGRIINIGSRQSRHATGSPMFLYAASKAGQEHLTRNLAFQYAAPLGITVNTVMPGPTDTDELRATGMAEALKNAATAEKRLGTVDDIAQIVAFVAEDGARWINGHTLNATGGAIMF
ncbi:NAD(P)-binding protein [Rhizodiscina lignyota]|uniref:NAD(P)-binding protein n=1 Tax=Rhizodiscina lignyota TaxID=1504668 RepID=A0A9P4MA01_9PEZI|nr:NAD(P)-binding protein [Rhizodiscina lignyota]